jgi:hypothetical protein
VKSKDDLLPGKLIDSFVLPSGMSEMSEVEG